MYTQLELTPQRTHTIAQFTGSNPWKNHAPEEWSLEHYVMVSRKYHPSSSDKLSKLSKNKLRFLYGRGLLGIRSDSDGRYHLLPLCLNHLLDQKTITNEKLPYLLHSIEEDLERKDFFRLVGKVAWIANLVSSIIFCALTVGLFFILSTQTSLSKLNSLLLSIPCFFASFLPLIFHIQYQKRYEKFKTKLLSQHHLKG